MAFDSMNGIFTVISQMEDEIPYTNTEKIKSYYDLHSIDFANPYITTFIFIKKNAIYNPKYLLKREKRKNKYISPL